MTSPPKSPLLRVPLGAVTGHVGQHPLSPRLDVIGAVSGVLALLVSGIQAWHDMVRTPNTVASNSGSQLDISYDPHEKVLQLEFPVLLRNDGSRDDELGGAKASLDLRGGPSAETLNEDRIALTAEGKIAVRYPYPLRTGSQPLTITVRSHPNSGGSLAQGESKVAVTLKAASRWLPPLEYCFDLTDSQIGEMRSSQRLWRRHVITTECGTAQDSSTAAHQALTNGRPSPSS